MYTLPVRWENTAILLGGPTRGGAAEKDCWGNPYCNDSKSSHTPPLVGTGNNVGEWLDLAAKADCVSGVQTVLRLARVRLAACRVLRNAGTKAENP